MAALYQVENPFTKVLQGVRGASQSLAKMGQERKQETKVEPGAGQNAMNAAQMGLAGYKMYKTMSTPSALQEAGTDAVPAKWAPPDMSTPSAVPGINGAAPSVQPIAQPTAIQGGLEGMGPGVIEAPIAPVPITEVISPAALSAPVGATSSTGALGTAGLSTPMAAGSPAVSGLMGATAPMAATAVPTVMGAEAAMMGGAGAGGMVGGMAGGGGALAASSAGGPIAMAAVAAILIAGQIFGAD